MARKTISVEYVRKVVNDTLKNGMSDDEVRQGVRGGMCNVLEEILFETGNYKGFRYLDKTEVGPGCRPGINSEPELYDDIETRFANTDNTRRYYF